MIRWSGISVNSANGLLSKTKENSSLAWDQLAIEGVIPKYKRKADWIRSETSLKSRHLGMEVFAKKSSTIRRPML